MCGRGIRQEKPHDMMHDDLLDLAVELAARGKTRPKQTSLRRSVSTSYYAVFHALANMCASELVGWSKPWEPFAKIYRALDHGAARQLFAKDRNGKIFGVDVAKIGMIFLTLQEARHDADYDPRPYPIGRSGANELAAQAALAVNLIASLPKASRLELAAALIVKKR